jgi:uncharacterized membrane protein
MTSLLTIFLGIYSTFGGLYGRGKVSSTPTFFLMILVFLLIFVGIPQLIKYISANRKSK